MQDDFDKWNEIKKKIAGRITSQDSFVFPKKKDVWACTLGKNIGREVDGTGPGFSRPVLVIKKFSNEMFWVVPLSSKQKNFDFYYNFLDLEGR